MSSSIRVADQGATIFAKHVDCPQEFGIVELDHAGKPVGLVEKPKQPRSNLAVVGLYIYDSCVVDIAKELRPSERGELEITDLNCRYLEKNRLNVVTLDARFQWFDAGNHDSLIDVSNHVRGKQQISDCLIGSPELMAFENAWIDNQQFERRAQRFGKSTYGKNLLRYLDGSPYDTSIPAE
jgi:glucose-1-phosphate thymidylyltransferase